jgi:hypothetical protein
VEAYALILGMEILVEAVVTMEVAVAVGRGNELPSLPRNARDSGSYEHPTGYIACLDT